MALLLVQPGQRWEVLGGCGLAEGDVLCVIGKEGRPGVWNCSLDGKPALHRWLLDERWVLKGKLKLLPPVAHLRTRTIELDMSNIHALEDDRKSLVNFVSKLKKEG